MQQANNHVRSFTNVTRLINQVVNLERIAYVSIVEATFKLCLVVACSM